MGGDEFCALVPPEADPEQIAGSLADEGLGFTVTASFGSVLLPGEVSSVSEALTVADDRMYAQKTSTRQSPGEQSSNVLFQALAERDTDLGEHLEGVTELAVAVGTRLGLKLDALHQLRLGGAPARRREDGRAGLDPAEARAARRASGSSSGGTRSSASGSWRPPRRSAARVRSSAATHERWDGTGYPDRLAGDDIALGARIVAVCDAYDAMVSDRPYRPALSLGEALQELTRGSGTQFDPTVVTAFLDVIAEPRRDVQPPSPARLRLAG